MRVARIFATVAASAVAGLAFATPAMADGTTVPIHSSQVPTTAADFDGETCTGPLSDLAEDKDGWHFVTTGQSSFTSVTLKFHTSSGDVTAVITGTEGAPSTGSGWYGFLDNAGDAQKHAYVVTTAGWELFDGSAVVSSADDKFFNLSHTCAGTPQNTSGSPSPDPDDSPSPSASASTPGGGGGSLPLTGTATGVVIAGGVLLVACGVGLLAIRRRRDIVG